MGTVFESLEWVLYRIFRVALSADVPKLHHLKFILHADVLHTAAFMQQTDGAGESEPDSFCWVEVRGEWPRSRRLWLVWHQEID